MGICFVLALLINVLWNYPKTSVNIYQTEPPKQFGFVPLLGLETHRENVFTKMLVIHWHNALAEGPAQAGTW